MPAHSGRLRERPGAPGQLRVCVLRPVAPGLPLRLVRPVQLRLVARPPNRRLLLGALLAGVLGGGLARQGRAPGAGERHAERHGPRDGHDVLQRLAARHGRDRAAVPGGPIRAARGQLRLRRGPDAARAAALPVTGPRGRLGVRDVGRRGALLARDDVARLGRGRRGADVRRAALRPRHGDHLLRGLFEMGPPLSRRGAPQFGQVLLEGGAARVPRGEDGRRVRAPEHHSGAGQVGSVDVEGKGPLGALAGRGVAAGQRELLRPRREGVRRRVRRLRRHRGLGGGAATTGEFGAGLRDERRRARRRAAGQRGGRRVLRQNLPGRPLPL
mmetsp:Transcript_9155/g.26739  ORF Transcript_9155/g.26739 Transcript_9155/m.26739 type:complete len:328 (+) Transcript_9155:215-1198(+)